MALGMVSPAHGGEDSEKKKAHKIDLETIRLTCTTIFARLQSRVSFETLRPAPVFLGVKPGTGMTCQAYTPPFKAFDATAMSKAKTRVQTNFTHFVSNYALVAAMVALVVALMHPSMLLFLGIVGGLWFLNNRLNQRDFQLCGVRLQTVLPVQKRFYALVAITALVVVWMCLPPSVTFLCITTTVVLPHALFRNNDDYSALGSEDSVYMQDEKPGSTAIQDSEMAALVEDLEDHPPSGENVV
jgi:hypothetical protein